MKKNLFLMPIFFITFFSKNVFSSYFLNNSLDCCLFLATTTSTYNCGYLTHKNCTFNFNQKDSFDVMCARTTGIIATTFVLDACTGGSCSPAILYTPIIAHNTLKIVDEYLNKPASSEFYNELKKSKIKEIK